VVICLERGADLHMAQLIPLPLTVSCFSRIQIGFTSLVLAQAGSRGQRVCNVLCSRHCGRILCAKCSEKDMPIIKYNIVKPVRVCDICFNVLTHGTV